MPDHSDTHDTSLDSLIPPRELDFVGGGDFVEIGNGFLKIFRTVGGLQPDHRVLDVGCGIGRMAAPLAGYLDRSGSYEGFDVVLEGIEWCRQHYTANHPNFTFRHADVFQAAYNPAGHHEAYAWDFPYRADDFDFAFLTSVFSHMIPIDLENYLWQVARTLRVGGRCVITWFLLNDESRRLVSSGKAAFPEIFRGDGYWSDDAHLPESATLYDESYVRALYARFGLEIEHVGYGSWCGREEFLSSQDTIVARKPGPLNAPKPVAPARARAKRLASRMTYRRPIIAVRRRRAGAAVSGAEYLKAEQLRKDAGTSVRPVDRGPLFARVAKRAIRRVRRTP